MSVLYNYIGIGFSLNEICAQFMLGNDKSVIILTAY